MGTAEVEPTEVGISHKKAYGKTSEKTQLKISKARTHGSHVSSSAVSESSQPTLDYVSPHLSGRNTQDYSPKTSSSLYTTADSERTKFMDNIPGIPANEQLTQRVGDRAGRTLFPPPSASNYGQNVAYPAVLLSDVKGLSRDPNNTSDLVFCKAPTNRHPKTVRGKSQAETEMQWNATQENSYRLRDDPRNRPVMTNELHYSRTRGRHTKDGGSNVVYNDVKFSGSSRQNAVARRSTTSSYSESPTDSQGSSTESESDISSSPDTSLKRRRRIRRKPSNKSIGSSVYGEDNTSESENQSISEASDTSSAIYGSLRNKRRSQFASEEAIPTSFVSYKDHRSLANKIRSSSLTSVSSLEGAGVSAGDPSGIQSPLVSPRGTSISTVKKIQIRSFTSFADSNLNNKENQPQRRRSSEEREPFKIRGRAQTESSARELSRDRPPLTRQGSDSSRDKLPVTRQGSESPSLSRSPFSLKSKPFGRRSSKESLFSDSECNNTPSDKGHASTTVFDIPVSPREQVARCNSAPPAPSPIDTRESRLHPNLSDSGLVSSRSAFVPVKPNKRTITDHEPNPPIVAPVTFADSRPEKGVSTLAADVLLQPVARHGNRPLSIVRETDEFVDVQENASYDMGNVEKISKKSHVTRSSPIRTSQDHRTSSPSVEDNRNNSSSTLRRLSYVKAQKNSADLPIHSPEMQSLNIDSNSDSSPSFSPAFVETPPSRRYSSPEANNNTKRLLKEFDPIDSRELTRTVVPRVVAEGDLISFDDENGEVKEPVKKRTKRISRPKIPTILSSEEVDRACNVGHFETSRGMVEDSDVSYNKGKSKILP